MTTSRKLTMAASYIRSAIEDVRVSSPDLARYMKHNVLDSLDSCRSLRPDLMGTSYNIS